MGTSEYSGIIYAGSLCHQIGQMPVMREEYDLVP
jgi:hypothetical protein